ncbi:MAG: hypothetical protein ACYDB7_07695 [Mycobacteriales bacterium]
MIETRPVSPRGVLPGPNRHAAAPNHVACSHCGSRRTTTIGMVLTDGTAVDFTSCRTCEGKSWAGEDGPLPLDRVLCRATRTR